MSTPTTTNDNSKALLYIVLGVIGLAVTLGLLVLLYFGLSYLAMNLFLGLDLSPFGRLMPGGWPGYALLGLGLGGAAGAVAAQHRFRLNKLILPGAGLLALALVVVIVLGNTAHFAPPIEEAAYYVSSTGQGQCPACATVEASSTKADAENRYTAAKLLDKDPTTAWISNDATGQTLQLTLTIPPDQQLIGLRLGNGYGKSEAVYASFSRVLACRIRLNDSTETRWTLPDTRSQDLFIPLTTTSDTTQLVTVYIDDTYSGDNHAEVALSTLTPVIKLLTN